jgi:NADPH-dependent ferric siderophore reductase
MSTDLALLRTHLAVVDRVVQVTPRVRRITFAGDDLSGYRTVGPDDFLYLLLPPPGRAELTIDHDFEWVSYYEMPEEERPVGANYTVRHCRPEQGEIDIDFVLHDDPGPASGWAERARPGDPAALWGPRTTYHPPDPVDGFLLAADETGLPATAAILEHLAGRFDGPVRVVVEVADAAEEQPLGCARRRSPRNTASLDLSRRLTSVTTSAGEDRRELFAPPLNTMPGQAEGPGLPDLAVTWLHRGGAPTGTTTALFDAVAALDLPSGAPYVWGGGESRSMTRIRKHVRHELGLPRERVSLTGYWRHAAHADDPDDEGE